MEPSVQPQLILVDADANSELRRLPLASIAHCPRMGEVVELSAARESGGGTYQVISVTHRYGDEDGKVANVEGIVVTLRPRHEQEEDLRATAIPDVVPLEALAVDVPLPTPVEPTTEPQ